jgi:hypothetical protein
MSVARSQERHSTSGATSDADAHLSAEIVRLDRAHHRPEAGGSAGERGGSEGVGHQGSLQTVIWTRELNAAVCAASGDFHVGGCEVGRVGASVGPMTTTASRPSLISRLVQPASSSGAPVLAEPS